MVNHSKALPRRLTPRFVFSYVASLFCWQIPANSKTVLRSRQFPARAPGIAACSCLIRLYSVGVPGSGVGFFRSSGAGFVSAFVPRLAPWAALFRRFAAGSLAESAPSLFLASRLGAALFFAFVCFVAWGLAWASSWSPDFVVASRAGAPAPHLLASASPRSLSGGPYSGCSIRYWRGGVGAFRAIGWLFASKG